MTDRVRGEMEPSFALGGTADTGAATDSPMASTRGPTSQGSGVASYPGLIFSSPPALS